MANTLDTIYALWLRELIRFIKSKSRVIGTGGQPLIWLAIVGVGFGSAFASAGLHGSFGTVSYVAFIAPGIIGMTILFSSIFGGVSVIWDRQFGFLKEILVAPVSRVGIVLGKVIGSTTVSLITAIVIFIVIVAVGIIPFNILSVGGIFTSIVFMILIAMTFVSIGLIIASYVNNIEGFQVLINFLILPLFFLSGALFPLTNAPLWMKGISAIDPLQYGVDGMRGALVGIHSYPIYMDFAIVLAVTVALITIADISFRKIQGK